MPVSAVDVIHPAFQHAKQQLLQPFRLGQWVRLAFVGLLAGEAGSGGGCNFNHNFLSTNHPHGSHLFGGSTWAALHPALFVALIVLAVAVGLGLFVFFTYINSVMRFVLFDSVVARECRVRQSWARNRARGFRLFVWQIVFTLAITAATTLLVGFAALLAWRMGWFSPPGEHILQLVLAGCLFFLILLALLLTFSVVHVMTKDFVVPLMSLEDLSAIEGWRRLWTWLSAEKAGYAGYIGMKIVMAIGAGIAFGIIALIIFLALLIPIGGLGLVAVLGGKAAGLTWTFYTIALAVLAGCFVITLLLFVISLISVPAIVFFPAYSIYFFAPRYPALAALLWPHPQAPQPPSSPSWQPPPLPPAPVPST